METAVIFSDERKMKRPGSGAVIILEIMRLTARRERTSIAIYLTGEVSSNREVRDLVERHRQSFTLLEFLYRFRRNCRLLTENIAEERCEVRLQYKHARLPAECESFYSKRFSIGSEPPDSSICVRVRVRLVSRRSRAAQ